MYFIKPLEMNYEVLERGRELVLFGLIDIVALPLTMASSPLRQSQDLADPVQVLRSSPNLIIRNIFFKSNLNTTKFYMISTITL